MKKFMFLLLTTIGSITVFAQVTFDALTFFPAYPKANDVVTYQYTKKYGALVNDKAFDVVVYLASKSGMKVLEPVTTQKGEVYSGNFKLDSNTNLIAFSFQGEAVKDNNKGKGYLIPVYNKQNNPVIGYYPTAGQLVSGAGEYLFGMGKDGSRSLAIFEEGITAYPDYYLEDMFFNAYLQTLATVKKKEAQPVILTELHQLSTKKDLSERDLSMINGWYSRFKMKSAADSVMAISRTKFPQGEWKKQEELNVFRKETNASKKKDLLTAFLIKYPAKGADTLQAIFYKSMIAEAYAKEKNYPEFYKSANMLPIASQASLFNNLSWYMAEKGEDMEQARKMSYIATTYAKNELNKPTGKKPDNYTKKQWLETRQSQYAMYADTYGFILYTMGDHKAGLPYAKDGAELNKLKNAEYNERYALLLEKSAPAAESKKIIEQFVRDGVASAKTKAVLKNIYLKEHSSEQGYEPYLKNLEMAAKIKKDEEIKKSMINESAPAFALKDFDGNEVSLASLKGKVVIVDFWATWCGPCIASMPAMKIAQEKFKQRDDVKFLFVDTWESVENKKQNAQDFMKKSNYPFHVLMDDEDKMVGDYQVSGIPTKFIVDKSGRTRFKSIGFGGNDDALVDELTTMVELASE